MNEPLIPVLFVIGFLGIASKADVAAHFQYVFGPNPQRAKHMKPETLFDSEIQIRLAEAAAKGDTNKLQSLIDRGTDVNCVGRKAMRPLFWAIINENIRGVTYLLDHGADPNALVTLTEPPRDNALTLASYEEPRVS